MAQTREEHFQRSFERGRKLARCEPDEEIVISGMAGAFPESENVQQFLENLLAKKDLTTGDHGRWKIESPPAPQRLGKLKAINKFDASFFGIPFEKADFMDPQGRMLFEKVYEAIVDAGYNPVELKKSPTGILLAVSGSDSELNVIQSEKWQKNPNPFMGTLRSLMAERVSFWLDVHGPSYSLDAGCASFVVLLERAYSAIRSGDCNAVIIAGTNICLIPHPGECMQTIGFCSTAGRCRSFDAEAGGYGRADAIGAIFLQRKKDARRVYASLMHVKVITDGFKEEGFHCPSFKMQKTLQEAFYDECQVDPNGVEFIECHGTGTQVGDLIELNLIGSIFLKNRIKPLQIGSVKSNMGHSESASGLCSVVKAILCFENKKMLPNINFTSFSSRLDSNLSRRLQVVTESTSWEGNLIAINSVGLGGVNGHILLRSNQKLKGCSESETDDLPRLVLLSGRTPEAINVIFNDLESRPLDAEYIGLWHQIQKYDIPGHVYRGFIMVDKNNEKTARDIRFFAGIQRPVWFIYSGLGSSWATMGEAMLKIPLFAQSIRKCHEALVSENVDVFKIITENDPSLLEDVENSFAGIVAISIALTDLLTAMDIRPDGFIGHSLGELLCAYADGCLTLQQTMLLAYYRGVALKKFRLTTGSMAAIGLKMDELEKILPPELDISCHNNSKNYTVSGPENVVKTFVKTLNQKGIYAQQFFTCNIAAHSRYLENVGPVFQQYAESVIKNPKLRSNKWISSTFLEADWASDKCRFYSAEHVTRNLLGTVYFEEAVRRIPENAVVIEIAPHGVLQSILKGSLTDTAVAISLMRKKYADNRTHFLSAVGSIYEAGVTPNIAQLYPPVEFPVSKGTSMISPLIKWDHNQDWYVLNYEECVVAVRERRTKIVSLSEKEDEFLNGHGMLGKTVYPAAGYLILVWEALSELLEKSYLNVAVTFQNVRFLRSTMIPEMGRVKFTIVIYKNVNTFEVVENNDLVVTGTIGECKTSSGTSTNVVANQKEKFDLHFTRSDVYREFRLRGHDYKGVFRGITCSNLEGTRGSISWRNNFVCFIDSIFQMQALTESRSALYPCSIQRLVIDPVKHFKLLKILDSKNPEFPVCFDRQFYHLESGGVEIKYLKFNKIPQSHPVTDKFILEKTAFIPYSIPELPDINQIIAIYAQILCENIRENHVRIIEWVDGFTNLKNLFISQLMLKCIRKIPSLSLIQAHVETRVADVPESLNQELFKGVTAKYNESLPCNGSYDLIIASQVLNRPEILKKCFDTLKTDGWLLAVEKTSEDFQFRMLNLDVCMACAYGTERILLLRKILDITSKPTIIKFSNDTLPSISYLRDIVSSNKDVCVILLAEEDPHNGILGLFQYLRKQTFADRIRCFFILDENAPKFSPENSIYKSQLNKRLAVNVYKDGYWGSYKQLKLDNQHSISASHAFADCPVPGNVSMLRWLEGPLNSTVLQPYSDNKSIIHVYCASINYRDLMLVSEKPSPSQLVENRIMDSTQGMEFVGKANDGRRFMGIVSARAIANVVECDENHLLPIPDTWTFEDAATIYYSYGKVLEALFVYGSMQTKQSIFIQSGATDIGLAAITVCLDHECTIFTIVNSMEKKEFLKKAFPSIPENHIGFRIDELFEKSVSNATSGAGVDFVLANENTPSVFNLVAAGGHVLAMGKFDATTASDLENRQKNISIHIIGMDFPAKDISRVKPLMERFVENGVVKPLPRSVFGPREIKTAYRYLASGRAIGKVIIKIRNEESDLRAKPKIVNLDAIPTYLCRRDRTYVIYDDCRGHGLEIGEWLIHRGARNLMVIIKEENISSYQQFRIKFWESIGAKILISTYDTVTEEKIEDILEKANSLKPVSGIFMLTELFEEKKFEAVTEDAFQSMVSLYMQPVLHFDKLSRKLCPFVEHFVAIKSLRCGSVVGGKANSATLVSCLERICEKRRADGFPAIAITYGRNSDYFLSADHLDEIPDSDEDSSTKDWKQCLEFFDKLLKQSCPMVSCVKLTNEPIELGNKDQQNERLVDVVLRTIGLQNLDTVSLQSTLAEKGMDSLLANELKSILKKKFNICLTLTEIVNFSFVQWLKMEEDLNGKVKI